jgi:hypothetical protein
VIDMNAKRPWIVELPKTAPLQTEDGPSFLGRVREIVSVILAGRPVGNLKDISESPKKNEAS